MDSPPLSVPVLEGNLKQQCVDEKGYYDWVRKTVQLDFMKSLLSLSPPPTSTSISAAKHAKEWTVSSPVAGYGFDLIWTSGDIWSFIAPSEVDCHRWVEGINICIKQCEYNSKRTKLDALMTAKTPEKIDDTSSNMHDETKLGQHVLQHMASAGAATTDKYSNAKQQQQQQQQPIAAMRDTSTAQSSPESLVSSGSSNSNNSNKESSAISSIDGQKLRFDNCTSGSFDIDLNIDSGVLKSFATSSLEKGCSSIGNSNIQASVDEQDRRESVPNIKIPTGRRVAINMNDNNDMNSYTNSSVSNSNNNDNNIYNGNNNNIHNGNNTSSGTMNNNMVTLTKNDWEAFKSTIEELKQTVINERRESSQSRDEAARLQNELTLRTSGYEEQLRIAWERERKAIQDAQGEIENRILTHDSNSSSGSYYEASVKILREQHQREIKCLKEELTEERKRYAALLQREVKSRDFAESNELQFKRDLEELKVIHKHLQSDYASLKESFDIKQHAWETEKSLTAHDWNKRLLQVVAEKDEAMNAVHLEARHKITEISQTFDGQMKEFERVVSEATKTQLEGEKIREMGLMQMKCQGEIEAVRTDERRLCVLEIDRVKAVFLTRERETAEDIIELEKVHANRVSKLEHSLQEVRNRLQETESQRSHWQAEAQRLSEECKRQTSTLLQKMAEMAEFSKQRQGEFQKLELQNEECRQREISYREKLSHVLEEGRLQRAEYLESKRQFSENASLVFQWKKAVDEVQYTNRQTESALQIAKDEIVMLEHELRRQQNENRLLRSDVQRADRLVYGTSLANNNNSSSSSNINNSHNSPMQSPSSPTRLKKALGSSRTPTSNAAAQATAAVFAVRNPKYKVLSPPASAHKKIASN